MTEFRLPEIGENIEEATVTAVFVEAGGAVGKDEPIVELETEKAAFELPCPFAGNG
ncbi:biotin/lipoyl-containing protein [Candidatus Mycalebacterium sp.]